MERSVDGILVLSPDGRILFANPSSGALFGRQAKDLVDTEFGFPATVGETTEIDLVQGGGHTLVAEMRVAETTWEGAPALLVLIRDITDRKEAEERERALIREQAARAKAEAEARRAEVLDRATRAFGSTLDLDDLLRALADAMVHELGDVCLVDVDDQHGPMRRLAAARRDHSDQALLRGLEERAVRLRSNSPEARVFRTGRSELVPEVTEAWLTDAAAEDEWFQLCHTIQPTSLMMITLHAGTLPWGVVTVFSCDPSVRYQKADLDLASEVVRRACIAIENARLFRLAQEANRAKSDFLAVVSHELRTPLSAIVGYAGILEEEISGPLTPDQASHVASINRTAMHLTRLIDQLMVFARLEGERERVEREEIDPARVAREVVALARSLAERKELALELSLSEEPLSLVTDEKKLAQILINLVTNAIRYTEKGTVRLELASAPEGVVFRVQDTGVGIDGDRLEEIFLPFHQLDDPRTRKEGGVGIGLSLVKDLTRLLGGEVGVESTPGKGSTFTVRLPRVHMGGDAPGTPPADA